ncbi:hypothetical protein A3J90_03530 [candidate division WOR-1 bacterium RIFOXYC2_FULL_37_10]|uniref:Uncharacterized protein n=1 Tax=candidate division WOR-1 bacterium RIFOXYB2_FULL_37_13 TaxID=1802579 RepID=A0A1F4SKN8_UNCSA|nr:MAG: hypothetical protein A2310_00670 [candidate division WOR-1 bacterium RIFOXYB2_FULL_37_13]OGC33527.1 MAG: hypothetical protein A3J90_03530 [candidate division WOR-1 bacterium RIFOXYC2_FULL_37_10]
MRASITGVHFSTGVVPGKELLQQKIYELNGRGVSLLKAKHYEAAIVSFEAVLRLEQQNTFALNGLGRSCFELNQPQRAASYFEQTLALNPIDVFALTKLGLVKNLLHEFSEAEKLCRQALEIKPNNFDALHGLGTALAHQNRNSEAEECLREALPFYPEHKFVLRELGLALFFQNKYEGAVEFFNRALVVWPEDLVSLKYITLAFIKLNRANEAFPFLSKAETRMPGNAEISSFLGLAAEAQEEYALAEEAAKAAMKEAPEQTRSLRTVLAALYKQTKFDEIVKICTERKDQETFILYYLAISAAQRRALSCAMNFCHQAVEKGLEAKADIKVAIQCIDTLFPRGKMPPLAKTILLQTQQMDPENIFVMRLLATVALEDGQYDEIEKLLTDIAQKSEAVHTESVTVFIAYVRARILFQKGSSTEACRHLILESLSENNNSISSIQALIKNLHRMLRYYNVRLKGLSNAWNFISLERDESVLLMQVGTLIDQCFTLCKGAQTRLEGATSVEQGRIRTLQAATPTPLELAGVNIRSQWVRASMNNVVPATETVFYKKPPARKSENLRPAITEEKKPEKPKPAITDARSPEIFNIMGGLSGVLGSVLPNRGKASAQTKAKKSSRKPLSPALAKLDNVTSEELKLAIKPDFLRERFSQLAQAENISGLSEETWGKILALKAKIQEALS